MNKGKALICLMLALSLIGASPPMECPPKLPAPPVLKHDGSYTPRMNTRMFEAKVEVWKTQVWALIESCKIAQQKRCEEICKGDQGKQPSPAPR